MELSAANLQSKLQQLPSVSRFYVAFSGGLDSHVLLHLCHQLHQQHPQLQFTAVHVNHGLQAEAPDWVEHCQQVCDALSIPLEVHQVHIDTSTGQSLEALAREARYEVFQNRVAANQALLMAHHQDDQAETLLLQLFRGAGVAGLAAMPERAAFAQGYLLRPLLGMTREQLEAYAWQQGLNWVEDPSNLDTIFDRNFLRHEVFPLLKQRWPSISDTLGRAASYQAEAAHMLKELAERDFQQVKGETPDSLSISALQTLAVERQHNLVRFWIKQVCGLAPPDSVHLERIFNEVVAAAQDATPLVSWPGTEVRRYRDALIARPGSKQDALIHEQWQKLWDTALPMDLPDGSQLIGQAQTGQGLSQDKLQGARIEVRFRRGGESCRPVGRGHTHSLKKLMQEWAIPPWQRGQIPLVYVDDQLAQVVGFCLCEPFAAKQAEQGLFISQTEA